MLTLFSGISIEGDNDEDVIVMFSVRAYIVTGVSYGVIITRRHVMCCYYRYESNVLL